jgi:uncharacterized protein (DUF608 family)
VNNNSNHLTRRRFIGLVSAGAAATLFTHPAWGAFDLSPNELKRWRRSLFETDSPRRYLSNRHTDARMHLGGIGTGNFEIGADGQLTTWQLFNTLRDGQIPFYFGIKAGDTAKLLQATGGPDWPRVKQIEMTGEYPLATLRFQDEDLPVKVELDAFTPFAPLDTKLSSMPLAVFKFRLRNPTSQAQTVSLAAMLANPVGYAAIGEIQGNSHPSFGSNTNELFRDGQATGLFLRAESGNEPTLDKPVYLYLLEDLFTVPPDPEVNNKNYAYIAPTELNIPLLDRPENLKIQVIGNRPFSADNLTNPVQSIIWLEDAPVGLSEPLLAAIKETVVSGATLVFSGGTMPLLAAYAKATNGRPLAESADRPDIVFEDFEGGYDKWTVSGEAFGHEPAHGTFPGQQPVSGFSGKGLVNSFVGGDDTTGKLTSQTFTIERNYIRFLVGGGHYSTTQIRLVINGKAVRAAAGKDNERLESAVWNVQEFVGQAAHLEIVDDQKGGWGHINVDQIVFSDWPVSYALLQRLESLLPIRFSAVQSSVKPDAEHKRVTFQNQVLNPESKFDENQNSLNRFTRPIGRGKVVLFDGQLLNSTQTYSARVRQTTYSILCSLVGANYTVTAGQSAKEPGYGTLALAALAGNVTGLTHFENWQEVWKQFQEHGQFLPFESLQPNPPTPAGQTTNCALAATISVQPGETVEVPFLLTWHYPNKYSTAGNWMGCYYATQWPDARAVMREAVANYDKLGGKTKSFRDTFYDSTLPYWLLDGMTANSAIARHIGVVFRIANGDIYGWEGSNGSCEPTCTHVWGYEQSLAHLFPDLEKEMRRIDYFHQQNADGGINNRTDVPSPPHPTGERPFTDGHASCILKAYREALNSTDDSFFKNYWPHVKRAVEYLIQRDAKLANGQPIGILQDDQWNTYDEALHGVTTFISGYYLAALRVGEEWAKRMNDVATASRFRKIFESGQKKLIELCWNGEYFQQHLPDYLNRNGEVGPGCMSDQLIGQWWAHQLDLGYILPKEMVVSALRSIFKYNWKSDLTGWQHKPRAYAGARDKGLIICTWPKGGRPENVMLYSDEVWTGVEYQVAAHLIYEGMVEEGFCVAKGARDRYDGVPRPPIGRNPWCEIECGGHYTRAMSSWSLLLALSGFHYDGPQAALRFTPSYKSNDFKSFFSSPEGWGSFSQKVEGKTQKSEIAVKSGKLCVKTLELTAISNGVTPHIEATLDGRKVTVESSLSDNYCRIHFENTGVVVEEGTMLEITMTV